VAEQVRKVGRFEIVSQLGRGGMAVVWLARQTDLDRQVALKELPAFHAQDPMFVERFLRESRIAGGLNHPNVVTVHDYFEHEGIPYISMEYLERGSLRPHVGHLTVAQAAGVLEGVLAALAYAASRSIVHRDLKPENLMLSDDGAVKVADFGIAKALDRAATSFGTATGTTVGTPAYMAPEQAMGQEVDQRTDLYSTGIIAYEMLVGRIPFEETDTPLAMLLKHVNERPPAPKDARPDLDPRLSAWIERMIAKRPEERPPNAAAAWEVLEEIVLDLLGPRWRRGARILERDEAVVMPGALTPAPFPSEAPGAADGNGGGAAAGVEEFRTYVAPAPPRPPAPEPVPAAAAPAAAAAAAPPPPPPAAEAPAPAEEAPPAPAPAAEDPFDTLPPTRPAETEFQFPSIEQLQPRRFGGRGWLYALLGLVVVGGGVGAIVGLSGGGGSKAPQPTPTLTAAEYRQQGNRVCAQTQAGLSAALAGAQSNPTRTQIRNAVELYLNSTVAQRLAGLKALVPPAQLAADHNAMITAQTGLDGRYRAFIRDLDAGKPLQSATQQVLRADQVLSARADAAFRRLGLTRCI